MNVTRWSPETVEHLKPTYNKDSESYIRDYKKFWSPLFSDTYDSIIIHLNNVYVCPSHEAFVEKYLQINAEYPDNFQQALNRGCVFVDIEKNKNNQPVNIFYSPTTTLKFQYDLLETMAIVYECNLYSVVPEYRKFTVKEKRPIHMYVHDKAGTVIEDGKQVYLKYSPPGRSRDTFL